ncbi:hypothetical protein HG537_0C00580 [Torulaspora globosa]|uniref:K Homology domain-containing protein n=1 Tax=Torulaspora globosa TaxID=48254 RepID=A0A7H9HQ52_9SACH|nr:hypothetical protein HG537_0C00580 [Torulaspora sp. CBS 2947]
MGDFAGEPLQELDVNCLVGLEERSSAAKTTGLVARIDTLPSRRSYVVRETRVGERYMVLEADWYEFRSQLDRLGASLVRVTRTANGTAVLVLYASAQEWEPFGSWHWIRVRLNRLVSYSQLHILVPYLVSADSKSVVLPQITSRQLSEVVSCNSSVLTYGDEVALRPAVSWPAVSQTVAPVSAPQAAPQAHTQELHLTKAAVTYLIGTAGERIETTRLCSQATIKVFPISKRLSASEQNHPRSQQQTLALTGTRHQLATAMALLETQLNLHYQAPNHQI